MQSNKGAMPTVLGYGLITLDIIVAPGGQVTHSVGGTCANVLTLLAANLVKIKLAGKLGQDIPGDLIIAHLEALGSDLSFVLRKPTIRTPRITELAPKNGSIRHRFTFTCPSCGNRLPRSFGLREEEGKSLSINWRDIDLFFFDRASPTSVHFAKVAREAGAIVMFEPPRSQSNRRLSQGIAVADIVKYSSQDFRQGLPVDVSDQPRLLIETQDGEGLRFSHRQNGVLGEWHSLPAFDPVQPRDAAGAGDWCTAGFISELIWQKDAWNWTDLQLKRALTHGQALAALSVCFIGPLGAYYRMTRENIALATNEVLLKGSVPQWTRLQGCSDAAFGPSWPQDLRLPRGTCDVCLLEPKLTSSK